MKLGIWHEKLWFPRWRWPRKSHIDPSLSTLLSIWLIFLSATNKEFSLARISGEALEEDCSGACCLKTPAAEKLISSRRRSTSPTLVPFGSFEIYAAPRSFCDVAPEIWVALSPALPSGSDPDGPCTFSGAYLWCSRRSDLKNHVSLSHLWGEKSDLFCQKLQFAPTLKAMSLIPKGKILSDLTRCKRDDSPGGLTIIARPERLFCSGNFRKQVIGTFLVIHNIRFSHQFKYRCSILEPACRRSIYRKIDYAESSTLTTTHYSICLFAATAAAYDDFANYWTGFSRITHQPTSTNSKKSLPTLFISFIRMNLVTGARRIRRIQRIIRQETSIPPGTFIPPGIFISSETFLLLRSFIPSGTLVQTARISCVMVHTEPVESTVSIYLQTEVMNIILKSLLKLTIFSSVNENGLKLTSSLSSLKIDCINPLFDDLSNFMKLVSLSVDFSIWFYVLAARLVKWDGVVVPPSFVIV